LLDIGGKSIVDRVLYALEPIVEERLLLANDTSLAAVAGVRLILDPTPHGGVLAALRTGLENTGSELCLAVGGDMPFVSTRLFEYLLQRQRERQVDVVIAHARGLFQPLHAVYRREPVLDAVKAALVRRERRMNSYFAEVRVYQLEDSEWEPIDPDGRAFFNVNTPEDLAEARRIAARDERR
jgi:molybdopterin-guanine dinucleotide biosynthesis protein A